MKTILETKTTMKTKSSIALLALCAALGAAACDRAHLTASHGRANREAFSRQVANPNAATKPAAANGHAVQGLDSQEAAIIARTYRENLAPKKEDTGGRNQLLYVAPRSPQGDRGGELPPPSVPQSH